MIVVFWTVDKLQTLWNKLEYLTRNYKKNIHNTLVILFLWDNLK